MSLGRLMWQQQWHMRLIDGLVNIAYGTASAFAEAVQLGVQLLVAFAMESERCVGDFNSESRANTARASVM